MSPPDSPTNLILLRIFQCLSLCNCCVVLLLGVVVVVLFGKVEMLSAQVSKDQEAMELLAIQVQEKQQGQIQELHEQVQEEHNLTVTVLAGTFTLLTCLISMFHMTSHLQRFNVPNIQRKIVAILWMSPIYSVTSFASLIWPAAEGYLAIIKDCYEAYCIYTFLSFLIAVLGKGDRQLAVQVMARHADHLAKPTRWLSNWYHPPPESSDLAKAKAVLTECQILTIQFVLIRPLTSIASFMIGELEKDDEPKHHYVLVNSTSSSLVDNSTGFNSTEFQAESSDSMDADHISRATVAFFTSPGFFISMITNVSVFFAFTGLLKFFHAVQADLQDCNPWPKFLTIKGVVFLTFWQGLAIMIVVHFTSDDKSNADNLLMEDDGTTIDPSERAAQLQNILVCLEMLVFSITHYCVFPVDEWQNDKSKRRKFAAKPGIGFRDLVSDVNQLYHQSRSRTLSRNSQTDSPPQPVRTSGRRHHGGYDYHGGEPSSPIYAGDDDLFGLNRPGGDIDETVILFPEDATEQLTQRGSEESLKIV